jgi:hypothetical protein
MRLSELKTDGVRALSPKGRGERRFDLSDRRGPADVVAVTGPPASGKTTFLEAILVAKEQVAPYGSGPDAARLVAPGLDAAKIATSWALSPLERDRFDATEPVAQAETLIGASASTPAPDPVLRALLGGYSPDPQQGKVEYFHARRSLPVSGQVDLSKRAGDTFDRRMRLSDDDKKYAGLVRFIVSAGLGVQLGPSGALAQPGRVTRAFAELCATKQLGGLYQRGDGVLPGFVDAEGNVHGLAQLSDSETDALLFAATFVRAGLVANEPGSIVLVDTPERFLGDAAAGPFVAALHALGPNNQLIVATSSSTVIERAGAVVDLGVQG